MLHSDGGPPYFIFPLVPYSFAIVGLQGVPLLSGRSSLCLQKRGKGLGESFCVHELLRVLDLHIPARVFIHTATDD